MKEEDLVYGFGEAVRGINKRGFSYESFCLDDDMHTEQKHSLYGAHNFFMVSGEESFGVFVDYPGRVRFDVGETVSSKFMIIVEEFCFDLYIIEAPTMKEINREFRKLIGRSYIPPKWAFGYQQSRWSYKSEEEVREVATHFREKHIPIDAIYLDIDYMDHFKDFTVSNTNFPNLQQLIEELKQQRINLVPIIDAGVKMEEGYSVYEEGIRNGYFCTDENGEPFVAGVWPGKVHFPDVLNPDARTWFGSQYKSLYDMGIEGFWNDMNEPAMFYSLDGIAQLIESIENVKGKNLDMDTFFQMKDKFANMMNNLTDYQSFYHNVNGVRIRHDKVHNLYGFNMTRAAKEVFDNNYPEKRILLFSRASYIGMHRYAGIWTGDNRSWWSQLLLNIQMMPALNMCGFLYSGADIGGFGDNTTEELIIRWMQFGIFTPLMRNHSAAGTRRQEPYAWEKIDVIRKIIGIRYGLIPYLYSEYMKAVLNNEMLFYPLAFEYPDDSRARGVENQLMVGESIMIAPMYIQNARGRYVYLPEDMLLVRLKSVKEREYSMYKKGDHYIDVPLDEVVLFVRKNHIFFLGNEAESVPELDSENLEIIAWADEDISYQRYDDDGETKKYRASEHYSTIWVEWENNQYDIKVQKDNNTIFKHYDGQNIFHPF
jgi:Alpha-glucosidases, family 31 of glycosyl hydrolases